MAICTQDFKIRHIGEPIFYPSLPRIVVAFELLLFRPVNMIDVKAAMVRTTTVDTLAAKPRKNIILLLPVTSLLVKTILVLIPEIFPALVRAIRPVVTPQRVRNVRSWTG